MEALQCRSVAGFTAGVVVQAAAVETTARRGRTRGRAVMIAMSKHGAHCGAAQGQSQSHFNKSALSRIQDWRAYSTNTEQTSGSHQGEDSATTTNGVYATVEKANDTKDSTIVQRYGTSESLCDEGSSVLAVESVLETEGGNSVEDYKLRAHIFSESAVFFAALKDRNNNGVSQQQKSLSPLHSAEHLVHFPGIVLFISALLIESVAIVH